MSARFLHQRIVGAAFVLALVPTLGSAPSSWADTRPADISQSSSPPPSTRPSGDSGLIIYRIEFRGLRRIPASTLRAHIQSREGEAIDVNRIEEDVRALDALGWFDAVSAVVEEIPVLLASMEPRAVPVDPLLRLVFIVEERPFLSAIEFRGSRVISSERVAALLADKGIAFKIAAPVDPNNLWRAARAIEAQLADERHPLAKVHIRLEDLPSAAVRATLEIYDGPEVSVRKVNFTGNQAFSQAKLERQMKHVAPDARFAGWRGKDVYTPQRLQEDLSRLEEFYRDHGYPEARIGQPVAELEAARAWRWLPWPRRRTAPKYRITIPVQEGRFYRLSAIDVQRIDAAQNAVTGATLPPGQADALVARLGLRADEPYSQKKLENARDALTRLPELHPPGAPSLAPTVEVTGRLDPESGTARVSFEVSEARPYLVRRIEFRGPKRFSDKYYRSRVLLKEGEAFEPEKLERGLARLAREGFIRPVRPDDVDARFDDQARAVDLAIHVQEIGRQKISLVGGHSGLGSTVGLVYNVFDLLGGEELITAHLEGGPESLQILLSVAKDSLFGTRVSLGLSLYNNVVKPALAPHQRLFRSSTSGFVVNTSYPLTSQDTFGASYQIARTNTSYGLLMPTGFAGLPNASLEARTASRSVGLNESHDDRLDRLVSSASVSGGWLGGTENLVRSTVNYSRFLPAGTDQQSGSQSGWAFRGFLSGVSSYRGDMPLTARLFAGDELVRGAGPGELGPYALSKTQNADGTATYHTAPSGADLVAAANTEYRVPIAPRTQAAAFFDAGSGWLLPNWLGPDKAVLAVGDSNLRAATGVELRWEVPGLGQTVRIHYAIDPLHIRRLVMIADGNGILPIALPHRRRAGLGWGLGALF